MPTITTASQIYAHLPLSGDVFIRKQSGDLLLACGSREAAVFIDRHMVEAIVSPKGQFRYLRLTVALAKANVLMRASLRINASASDNKTVSRIPTDSGHFYFEHNVRSFAYNRSPLEKVQQVLA